MPIAVTTSPGSTFTVTVEPASPMIGEACTIIIEGDGGHSVSDEIKDIWIETDLDDETTTFDHASGVELNDPEKAYYRVFCHAWPSAGTKTLTISSWTFGGGVKTQTVEVTVADPDSHSWDHTYWVDLNGTTTGMPADDASNTRITTWAGLYGISGGSGNDYRIRMRGGTTHPAAPTADSQEIIVQGDIIRFDTFGTSGVALLDVSGSVGSTTLHTLIRNHSGTTSQRLMLFEWGVKADYDDVFGVYAGTTGKTKLFSREGGGSGSTGVTLSLVGCTAEGAEGLMGAIGSGSGDQQHRYALFNCRAYKCQNYALGYFTSAKSVVLRACSAEMSRYAGMGDGKTGTADDFPDHAYVRVADAKHIGVSQCDFPTPPGGWSSSGRARQPCLRLYCEFNTEVGLYQVVANRGSSRGFAAFGHHTAGGAISYYADTLVGYNEYYAAEQTGNFVQSNVGGVRVVNNMLYYPDAACGNGSRIANIFAMISDGSDSGQIAQSAWEEPSYIGFNTLVSDMSATAVTSMGQATENTVDDAGSIGAEDITTENNRVAGDNHTNSGSLIANSAFSRGGKLRNITSGAADSTVTSGPPADFTGTQRSGSTQKGAFHASATSSSATAPSWSGTPAIAALTGRTDWYGVTTEGGVTDGTGLTICEVNWKLDGSDTPSSDDATYLPSFEDTGVSGSLTAALALTNIGGTRVTTTTSGVSI